MVGLRGAGTVCHRVGRVDFTLAFDSSPIKGEGDMTVGVVLFTRVTLPPLWIADLIRNPYQDGALPRHSGYEPDVHAPTCYPNVECSFFPFPPNLTRPAPPVKPKIAPTVALTIQSPISSKLL